MKSTWEGSCIFDAKEYQRQWRERNRDRLREYFRKYRKDHPELKELQAKYHAGHREERRLREQTPERKNAGREWRKRNRIKLNMSRNRWAKNNPDAMRAIEKRHAEKRKPTKRESDRLYRIENPEKFRQGCQRSKEKKPELYRSHAVKSALQRRTRIKGILTEEISLSGIIKRDASRCHLCLEVVAVSERSFDHLVPVVRNGATAEWNLMLAHLRCNQKRGSKRILKEETRDCAILYIEKINKEKEK